MAYDYSCDDGECMNKFGSLKENGDEDISDYILDNLDDENFLNENFEQLDKDGVGVTDVFTKFL